MTKIRVTCPTCGMVAVAAAGMQLTIASTRHDAVGPESHFEFTCSDCGGRIRKPASERVAIRLITTGAVRVVAAPLAGAARRGGLAHPEDPPAGPPLTDDDLLDLILALREDGWFEELVSTTGSPQATAPSEARS